MNLFARLSKKQGNGQIALNSVFLSHHGFRLKHIDNFQVRIFLEPLIYLQLPWWINMVLFLGLSHLYFKRNIAITVKDTKGILKNS